MRSPSSLVRWTEGETVVKDQGREVKIRMIRKEGEGTNIEDNRNVNEKII